MGVATRDAWNPATTWYLEDVIAATLVESEDGGPHPDDGKDGFADSPEEAHHIYEIELQADKKIVRSVGIRGATRGAVFHVFEQEVAHVPN